MSADPRSRVDAGLRTPWGIVAALAAGGLGACAGAALAELILRSVPIPMGSLEAARAAGVWSQTTWAGYPKSAEISFLAVGLLLSIGGGMTAACAVAFRLGRNAPSDTGAGAAPDAPARVRGGEWLVVAALALFGMQPGPLEEPGLLYRILSEEGAHLLALTTLAHGGRLFEHIDYLYGPLLLAPLAPVFWIEPSVHGIRVATLVLHGVGLGLLVTLARPLFRTRVGWIALALGLAWLIPLPAPRLHLTAWRSALAFAPFLFLPHALAGGRGGWLAVGAGCAVAILGGVDLWIASLLGPLAALLAAGPRRPPALGRWGVGLGVGLAAGWLLLWPIADPVGWLDGARETFVAMRLGYLARVFPVPWGASRLWLGDPFGVGFDVSPWLWPGNAVVFVGAACLGVTAFALLRGRPSARDALRFGLCVSAVLLLPKLVSRPGHYQYVKVVPGLLIVAAALTETAVQALRRRPGLAPLLPALCGIGMLGVLVVSSPKKAGLPRIPPAQPVHQQRMGPIPLHPLLADFMDRVRAAVDRRLPPGEAVWTAPAAPGWSFVLDRPPAHPLSISYVTTSDAERERIRRELAEAPPRLILRQADRSSFEGVPMRTYLGVAADRVDAHYRVDETLRVGEHVVEILVPR